MSDPLNTVKRRVRELDAYSLRPDRARIKLNQNESPWDAPAEIKQETLRRISLRPWSRYPDFVPRQFYERLAEFAGWQPDGIIAGNGSNEMIQALLMVTVGEGKRILISEPTFLLYRQITTVLGGDTISVPLTPQLTYDVNAKKSEIQSSNPDVTIICSPKKIAPAFRILRPIESSSWAMISRCSGASSLTSAHASSISFTMMTAPYCVSDA